MTIHWDENVSKWTTILDRPQNVLYHSGLPEHPGGAQVAYAGRWAVVVHGNELHLELRRCLRISCYLTSKVSMNERTGADKGSSLLIEILWCLCQILWSIRVWTCLEVMLWELCYEVVWFNSGRPWDMKIMGGWPPMFLTKVNNNISSTAPSISVKYLVWDRLYNLNKVLWSHPWSKHASHNL